MYQGDEQLDMLSKASIQMQLLEEEKARAIELEHTERILMIQQQQQLMLAQQEQQQHLIQVRQLLDPGYTTP